MGLNLVIRAERLDSVQLASGSRAVKYAWRAPPCAQEFDDLLRDFVPLARPGWYGLVVTSRESSVLAETSAPLNPK